ncbi:MAG: DNA-binding response regulator, partial [Pseudomonadota bacterium]
MFIVIDPRDVVASAYRAGFEREGFACTTFAGQDFCDWLQSLSASDLHSIQCVILGEAEERQAITTMVRALGRT